MHRHGVLRKCHTLLLENDCLMKMCHLSGDCMFATSSTTHFQTGTVEVVAQFPDHHVTQISLKQSKGLSTRGRVTSPTLQCQSQWFLQPMLCMCLLPIPRASTNLSTCSSQVCPLQRQPNEWSQLLRGVLNPHIFGVDVDGVCR